MQENVLESGEYTREPPDHPTLPHSVSYRELPGNVCCVLFDFVANTVSAAYALIIWLLTEA